MDLLNKLGAKSADGDSSTQSSKQEEPVKKAEESTSAATEDKTNGDAETKVEAKADAGVKDPDDWSKDSALKEVTKLREENKAQRLKYQEKLEEFKIELAAQNEPLKAELEELKQYKDELAKIKAAEEDKKRSLEDKVAHRESRIAELEAKMEAIEANKNTEVQSFKEKLSVYEAQEAARKQLYQEKLATELNAIPDKFKEQAELIAKGAGDPSEALVALNEARLKGLFEDKTVIVNHQVPGAKDGARATKEQLEGAARAERDAMSPQEKIKAALKDVRSGDGNSAFRTH
jgi:DNA repair exonuclease SbcCD ATPase subunit